ncbi:MAG: LPXTG cell wall anchor domain-containing protein [Magnetococcales bacterium]|nr:LPXTG cell wall anchor domain-containing protein [Magnetococcales bacterium]
MARNRLKEAGGGAAAAQEATAAQLPMIGGIALGVVLLFVLGYFLTRKKKRKK